MEPKPADVKLNILLVEEEFMDFLMKSQYKAFKRLEAALVNKQLVESVRMLRVPYYSPEMSGAYSSYGRELNTIFIDPFPMLNGLVDESRLQEVTKFISDTRLVYPEVVFVFYIDFKKLKNQYETFYTGNSSFSHYYKLDSNLVGQKLETELDHTLRLCKAYLEDYKRKTLYKYDIALSFAGEDRPRAQRLAQCLQSQGIRVFYDSFEEANLFGKNLYTYLHSVYSKEARYCVIFISSSYATKMWTVHERKSAQERALQEREGEYILPIKLDETELEGLPSTIAYLNGKIGIPKICKILKTKLDNQPRIK